MQRLGEVYGNEEGEVELMVQKLRPPTTIGQILRSLWHSQRIEHSERRSLASPHTSRGHVNHIQRDLCFVMSCDLCGINIIWDFSKEQQQIKERLEHILVVPRTPCRGLKEEIRHIRDLFLTQLGHSEGGGETVGLSKIILLMESRGTVILKDLEKVYRSLYDMLNRNYTVVGNRKKSYDGDLDDNDHTDQGFHVTDDLLFYEEQQLYVPEKRLIIMMMKHDSPLAGHFGSHKTKELVRRDYWWPKMYHTIESYVKSCDTCQRAKHPRKKQSGFLQPLE
ncbi:hypothetical protein PROFUN_08223, partial [Planoprotostelium fungivorum]